MIRMLTRQILAPAASPTPGHRRRDRQSGKDEDYRDSGLSRLGRVRLPGNGSEASSSYRGRDGVAKVDLVADWSIDRNSPLCADTCAHSRAFGR
jgi:hypothetical protein